MKIAHLSHRFWPCTGGIETHIMQLCEELNAKGNETKVVCLNKCPNSNKVLPAKDEKNGIAIERLKFLNLRIYRIAFGAIGKVKGFDTVHIHGLGFFSDYFALFKLVHKKRMVLSTHGGIFHTKNHSLLKKIYFNVWCRLTLTAFDKVIAVSKQDFETFKKIVPKSKLVLIENPVPVEVLSKIPRNPVPNSFLFVGRLSKNKGLENLLNAFAKVKKDGNNFSLKIAGKPFDLSKKQVQEMVSEKGLKGNAKVLGMVSKKELLSIYSESEFFVSASEYEGFGISAIEAMSAGLILVLNSIPPFKTFVSDGKTGFIVDFSDKERAGKAIKKTIDLKKSEKQKIRRNARAFSQKFSWKEGLNKFEKVYRN